MQARCFEIVDDLRLFVGTNLLDGFDFDDDLVISDEVGDVELSKGLTFVTDGKLYLLLIWYSP